MDKTILKKFAIESKVDLTKKIENRINSLPFFFIVVNYYNIVKFMLKIYNKDQKKEDRK